MVSGRYPNAYGCAQIAARVLGWATAAADLCILAYTINEWPDKGVAMAAGIAGSSMAMLNDSWIIFSKIDTQLGFNPMSHARVVVHDLFTLAVSLGGVVMIVFSRYTFGSDGMMVPSGGGSRGGGWKGQDDVDEDAARHGTSLYQMLWRFVFVIWGLFDCFGELRTTRYRFVRGGLQNVA
ncbi:hypothetical protein ESCO_001489 [Escovopsis weberi]|uniref:Uncharacterized protein n=1 Tax=Escovopsis weberi TaxID=150374 RepID=A0A0M9VW66_ESCWE|nr:hypothetical protein ESCO_001489 [Escovopsis weberi]